MDYREPEWVAERLGLDRNTVYKFLQEGTIPAVQLGRKWLISEARLVQWLEEETERQTRARRDAEQTTGRTVRRMDSFTTEAQAAIRAAHSAARRYNHHYLGQEHLLLGLAASDSEAGRVLAKLGVSLGQLQSEVETRVKPGETTPPRRLGRNGEAKSAMRSAEEQARRAGEKQVGSLRLLVGILESGGGLGREILEHHGISVDVVLARSSTQKEKA